MKRNEPARPRRLRPTDFPPPRPIPAESLEDIFCEFKITDNNQQASVKSLLNSLVQEFTEWIKIPQPRLADDRKVMQKMRLTISDLLEDMDQLGFFGTQALKSVAEHLGPMLSAEWINYRFPDDDWAPSQSWIDSSDVGLERRPEREPLRRGERYFVEELSRHSRYQFVQNRARETIRAILRELDRAMASAVAVSVDLGGPPTLTTRHFFLLNLVALWSSLDREISGGPKSDFITFCERVFEVVGWPAGGLDDAVQDAISDWRQRFRLTPPKKSTR